MDRIFLRLAPLHFRRYQELVLRCALLSRLCGADFLQRKLREWSATVRAPRPSEQKRAWVRDVRGALHALRCASRRGASAAPACSAHPAVHVAEHQLQTFAARGIE